MRHYKKFLATFILLLSFTMGWGQKVIFSEDFNSFLTTTTGKALAGGNDGQWSGRIANSSLSSYNDWEVEKASRGYQCIKLGTTTQPGWVVLPALTELEDGCKLTFRAGAWDDAAEHLVVKVEVGTFTKDVAITRAAFADCAVELRGVKSGDRIKISSAQDNKNRFFLDDIVVTAPGEVTPTPQPLSETVLKGLGDLRKQQEGNLWITFDKNDPARVSFIHNSNDVYVADGKGFVRFLDFLPTNKGWHPSIDGRLVGTVLAHYAVKDGLPTLTSIDRTDVRTVLCLTGSGNSKARLTTLAELENKTANAAELVELQGFTIAQEGNKYVAKQDNKQLALTDFFSKKELEKLGVTGQKRFQMTAIVAEDKATVQLYPITLKEEIQMVTLDDDKDCQNILNTHDECTASVKINRQLLANMWNTLCLPFDVEDVATLVGDEEANVHVAELKSYDAQTGTLQFETVQHIEAGKPYLIKLGKTVDFIEATNVILKSKLIPTTVSEDVVFRGCFAPVKFEADDRLHIFLGKDNKLYYPNANHPLRAFRAYFEAKGASFGVQRFSIDNEQFDITAIETLSTDEAIANEQLYDLDGRISTRTKKAPNGLYITREGKKIME